MTLDRRSFLTACSRAGITSALMPGILYTLAVQAQEPSNSVPSYSDQSGSDQSKPPKITPEIIDQAAILAGVGPFTAAQKQMMIDGLVDQNGSIKAIRKLNLPNSVAPAFVFHPLPAQSPHWPEYGSIGGSIRPFDPNVWKSTKNIEDLAFATAVELSLLIQSRRVSSLDLTKMYLARLKRYDAKLHFVITLTEERALAQAKKADEEIAAGKHRGMLHGVPWGAKDLLAVKGYPTTWGAGGFEHQTLDEDATVVQRLDAAGAVLVAKLSLGALAMGDKWFGGRTRNPWNPAQGSSGSSAGAASAVAAGCVGFAIGSETLGSIASPSTRCGCTGLRPTFGFVPRTGAMALSWTMDKLGPITRSALDCEVILGRICGPDGQDTSVARELFDPEPDLDVTKLRVGYMKSEFDPASPLKLHQAKPNESAEEKSAREKNNAEMQAARARRDYDRRFDLAALDKLKSMGINLIPVELPKLPYGAISALLGAEGAAAFDDLTRSGRDKLLTEQGVEDWPISFRVARFYPAVDYIQANRARTLAVQQVSALFESLDIIVAPTNGIQLVATNLTGHPALIVPNGLRGDDAPRPPKIDDGDNDDIGGPSTPVSLTFLAGHYQDAKLAAFGWAYQQAAGFLNLHPRLD
jgi:Asp-tRNA(Asn)/Glu-tRNA(Gln) amidotransferase A subunit family amidase